MKVEVYTTYSYCNCTEVELPEDKSFDDIKDVVEKDKEYQLRVEAAGMKKSDFSVSVKDGVLTITGEKQTEADDDSDNYAHRESCYGRFSRSFRLPDDVLNEKKVAAKYKDGVLTISLPRTKPVEIAGIEVEIK